MPERIFTVEVSGIPESISDFEIRTEMATALGRFFRAKRVDGGYAVGTSGGTVMKIEERSGKGPWPPYAV